MNFNDIFENFKNIAVVGMSKNSTKLAHNIPFYLISQGFNVIPVNPTTDDINGIKTYKSLLDITDRIDIVNVFRPSEDAYKVVQEAIERRKQFGDVEIIWLQQGIFSSKGKIEAEENGITFIENTCIYAVHLQSGT